ncbi:hypothetical protein [Silvimonas iriomotensis]|uniref:Lipoprotein n=1 Tax=Silvimonas iriomotensis TaxID=449662 RepID=A0ABQ2P907_9NEIS|nr:hypothetical protein [Silvimonas iriomotensis]GGP20869.1 hypothetical protein GCM10010970_17360 [Silvimonas iriomotensis]
MKQVFAFSAVALSLALAACGGGGGDSTSTSAPVATPTPTPAPTPAPTPVPTIQNPQAGSTAAVGNGIEGYWTNSASVADPKNASKNLVLIAPDGEMFGFSSATDTYNQGTLTFSGSTWAASGERAIGQTDGTFNDTGTFVAQSSFTDPTSADLTFDTYSIANALAVTQADATGTWGSLTNGVTVDASGNFSGSTTEAGRCNVSGSLLQFQPSTKKNLFKVTFTATQSLNCTLPLGQQFSGLATIDLINTGSSAKPVYVRALQVLTSIPHVNFLWLQLPKS